MLSNLLLTSIYGGIFFGSKTKELKPILRDTAISIRGKVVLEGSFTAQDEAKGKDHHDTRPHIGFPETKVGMQVKLGEPDKLNGGYVLRLNPGRLSEGILADRHYIFLNSKFGTWRIGNDMGPNHHLCRLAQKNMNTLWLEGTLDRSFSNPVWYFHGTHLVGHSGIATKISWYAPKYKGIQFAIAYTPNTAHNGFTVREDNNPHRLWGNLVRNDNPYVWLKDKDQDQPYGTHNVNVAAAYKIECGSYRVGFAGSYIFDRSKIYHNRTVQDVSNVSSYMVAGSFGKGRWTVATEYMNNGKSRLPKDNKLAGTLTIQNAHEGDAGKAVNTSLRYDIDVQSSVSLGHQYSWRRWNKNDKVSRSVYSLTYKRNLAKDLDWYIETNYISAKVPESVVRAVKTLPDTQEVQKSNSGVFFGTGFSVKF